MTGEAGVPLGTVLFGMAVLGTDVLGAVVLWQPPGFQWTCPPFRARFLRCRTLCCRHSKK